MNDVAVIDKNLEKMAIDAYCRNFDIEEVGRILLGERGRLIDDSIARMKGREFINSRKNDVKINRTIIKKRLDPDNLKCDAYKLSKLDSDGRVKVKALELLGKWQKMEEVTVNNFNMSMSWIQMLEIAHRKTRMNELEINKKELPADAQPGNQG